MSIFDTSLKIANSSFTAASPNVNELTHCGLVAPYGDKKLVNIGSDNDLLPDGTKPLPEPMLTFHQ